ncbi:uncharacterized protein V1516DRAFT_673277 [Lipomyces oligophaga]|uniref:uncharacterized protein n=1 Tax=Lipomyces oligophaga TaxID=45792 RepID=UPI0034CEDF2A
MRRFVLILFAFSTLLSLVSAWDEQDFEIFRLSEELEKYEGKGTSFYSFMGLDSGPSSTLEEITKAYRKKSRLLHPDKNPSKQATERFARLGVIANILRGPEKERYDFFFKKGFPRWKGTGYYYSRFRPGLFTVLVFLYLITSLAHYITLSITARTERARLERYISDCKEQAWPNGLPPLDMSKRRVQDGSGRIFTVYPDGSVWIFNQESNEEYKLDVDQVPTAQWRRTTLVKLPLWLWNTSVGRFITKPAAELVAEETKDEASTNGKRKRKPKLDADGKVVPAAASVVGGRRRKRK